MKDEKRLDEIISRIINTTKPQFDAEKWKQKYTEEFEVLKSQAGQDSQVYQPKIWRSPTTKIAAAAVIMIAIGLLIVQRRPVEQIEPPEVVEVAKSPVEMMTAISLECAFRRGGIEAVEKQCKQAFEPGGLRHRSLSVEQLLTEFNDNGKGSERTGL